MPSFLVAGRSAPEGENMGKTKFDEFVKGSLSAVCKSISDMTYLYKNPDTGKPTVVPDKHYKSILQEEVVMSMDAVIQAQVLDVVYKSMTNLKDEYPELFNQTLLLMDLGKKPDSLNLNEHIAVKLTAQALVEEEKTQKKKFHLLDKGVLDAYEETKNNEELMQRVIDGGFAAANEEEDADIKAVVVDSKGSKIMN